MAPLTGVILAAGAGTRLGELGRRHSKAMVPVGGEPLIAWGLKRLRAAGVERVVVVAHGEDDELARFLGDHREVATVRQQTRLGIADALCQALPLVVGVDAYLACACDSLFPVADVKRLIARGREFPGAAVVGLLDMGTAATASRSAARVTGERVVELVEKPAPDASDSGLVAAPLYWLPAAMRPFLENVAPRGDERYISTALNDFIRSGGEVLGLMLSERIEVTTAADVERATQRLASPGTDNTNDDLPPNR